MALFVQGKEKRMTTANKDIRDALTKYNVKQWELADKCNYSPNYFCVKLRHELSPEEKIEMFTYIQEIVEERKKVKS